MVDDTSTPSTSLPTDQASADISAPSPQPVQPIEGKTEEPTSLPSTETPIEPGSPAIEPISTISAQLEEKTKEPDSNISSQIIYFQVCQEGCFEL